MKIWVLTVGEPLPTDGPEIRLHRSGMITDMLSERGHDVIWWTSTFDHHNKKHRTVGYKSSVYKDRLEVRLLHGCGYRSNVSLKRIINHYNIAAQFKIEIKKTSKPDIILCSLPTLELCREATEFGIANNVPTVLDIRDLWPDIFVDLAPKPFHWMARLILAPMFSNLKRACRSATAIIGITPQILEWGLHYGKRKKSQWDRDFPLAYSDDEPSQEEQRQALDFWQEHGIHQSSERFIICFFGYLGRQFSLETVIKAAEKLEEDFVFVICGDGDFAEDYKTQAEKCPNIVFPGWVNKSEIWTLLRMSQVGLAPYKNSKDFMASIPNKAIEYLSAGLPVVSGLPGTLERLLTDNSCGVNYPVENSNALCEVLIELKKDPSKLKEMSSNALELFKNNFTADKIYGDLILHLDNLQKHHHGSSSKDL